MRFKINVGKSKALVVRKDQKTIVRGYEGMGRKQKRWVNINI